jgi:glyoxylase-like metal-dependent hydrolase (beta-lactamase superfamily II)
MSEPHDRAKLIEALAPDLLHWSVFDDRIDARSESYALKIPGGTILIDPLPLAKEAVPALGKVVAIVLTIQSHQRSAWRYRKELKAPVWAPFHAEGLEQQPDVWYREGDLLPGGLKAVHTPGPCDASYALVYERPGEGSVLFCGDLVIRDDDGEFRFVEDEYMDEPKKARLSARALLDLKKVRTLCTGHGPPALSGARIAIGQALRHG